MKNIFNTVQVKSPNRNYFDLTHDFKFTCNMGELVPILVQEVLPSDKFNVSCESLIRFAPMLAPIYQRINCSVHYFFVPNRILWDGFEKFITSSEVRVAPFVGVDPTYSVELKRFMDFMGVPPNPFGNAKTVNALPFAAYQCIYNEYYRDQNLVPEVDYKLTDGNNTRTALLTLRKKAWAHDYFTACLPFAQKGEAVDIPIGNIQGNAPVYYNNNDDLQIDNLATGGTAFVDGRPVTLPAPTDLYAATQNLAVGATTINDLRRAFRLQEWLEKNARGGTRYTEHIRMHFDKISSDARLQRPEYICGIKTPVVVSEVLNTAGDTLPQGNMSGHGIATISGNAGYYEAEEHGFIIGIMNIIPIATYCNGLQRMWTRFDPLEYAWPTFANIGEQEVLRQELYYESDDPTNEEVFGYIPRYSEYKYAPSRLAGQFRSTLDYWHLARFFDAWPNLNQEFIEVDPDFTQRIFAVTSNTDNLYCVILNKIGASRPLPRFGIPTI